jgi:hypothetical protein
MGFGIRRPTACLPEDSGHWRSRLHPTTPARARDGPSGGPAWASGPADADPGHRSDGDGYAVPADCVDFAGCNGRNAGGPSGRNNRAMQIVTTAPVATVIRPLGRLGCSTTVSDGLAVWKAFTSNRRLGGDLAEGKSVPACPGCPGFPIAAAAEFISLSDTDTLINPQVTATKMA